MIPYENQPSRFCGSPFTKPFHELLGNLRNIPQLRNDESIVLGQELLAARILLATFQNTDSQDDQLREMLQSHREKAQQLVLGNWHILEKYLTDRFGTKALTKQDLEDLTQWGFLHLYRAALSYNPDRFPDGEERQKKQPFKKHLEIVLREALKAETPTASCYGLAQEKTASGESRTNLFPIQNTRPVELNQSQKEAHRTILSGIRGLNTRERDVINLMYGIHPPTPPKTADDYRERVPSRRARYSILEQNIQKLLTTHGSDLDDPTRKALQRVLDRDTHDPVSSGQKSDPETELTVREIAIKLGVPESFIIRILKSAYKKLRKIYSDQDLGM